MTVIYSEFIFTRKLSIAITVQGVQNACSGNITILLRALNLYVCRMLSEINAFLDSEQIN